MYWSISWNQKFPLFKLEALYLTDQDQLVNPYHTYNAVLGCGRGECRNWEIWIRGV